MLESLDASFRVLATEPAADVAHIIALQDYFGDIPSEYLQIAVEATEIELQHVDGQYIRIWGPKGCIETDDVYDVRKQISGAIPIGDDGGGDVIFYFDGKHGFGLYQADWTNLVAEEAVFVASSLTDFLTKAAGIETFYHS